jgi:V/A-type H+-transporting ATPase subunit D
MLDRKERILEDELARLRIRVEKTHAEWLATCAEAAQWLSRAQAIEGRAAIAAAAPGVSARVEPEWEQRMGIAYPADVTLNLPEIPASTGGSTVSYTAATHRAATVEGARHAAALRATAIVSAELAATRSRRRAVERRWIPRMQEQLRSIEQVLEEQELEDILRLHWAAGNDATDRGIR